MFKTDAIINVIFLLSPIILGVMIGVFLPMAFSRPIEFTNLIFISLTLGFYLLFVAKLSNFKNGIYFSFGTSTLKKQAKWLYLSGHGLMFFGFFMSAVFDAALKLTT